MTGFIKYFGLGAILSAVQVTGIDFTISRDKVVVGSTGTLTVRCDVTETDVNTIYIIQIRRETTQGSGIFESVVQMEKGDATSETPTLSQAINNNKDFVAGGSYDGNTPNTYLTVSMNISKLVCNDARAYMCEMSYKRNAGSVVSVENNGTFSAYVYPQISLLEGRRNGVIVQGLSSSNQAAFDVGDVLELSCTATIGSLPATTIRWRKTSEMGQTDHFIGYQPPAGSFNEGTAISDDQCGYTRIATVTYNTTVADANRDTNLAFECYVSVSGSPYGTTYTTQNNPRFYADVSGGDQANGDGGDQANGGGGDHANGGDEGISDNKVTKRDLTAGAIGGVIVAVVILGVVIIVAIVRRQLTTDEAPRTRFQTENSTIGNNVIQSRPQPEIGQNDQSSTPGMYEHLQNTVEMKNKYVYDSLKADSEGSTDRAQYEKLQQAVCTPPTYTSIQSATLNNNSDRAYANLRVEKSTDEEQVFQENETG
ncbi:uncharacterized protein LOC123545187 isoform X3 [Mercenaria mercenaria]|uniref:uncharacterized protein LOC123545187 isoform X3 n=1 Tax=Mercenaria mercenaria TaxID=6596 RepID=UPI00234E9B7C|nr:uncharacterized protein LOC123545187 isoform X3 [Mercenaria mercenaria]